MNNNALPKPIAVAAVSSMVVLLAACASRGGDIPYDPPGFRAPQPLTTGALEQDHPIGPLDKLKITVFRVPELSGEYIVAGDGSIELPLVGRVSARNQTAAQLATALEAAYGEKYLRSPDISVQTITSNQLTVVVEGGVRAPGTFPVAGRTTLLGAIASASGVDPERGNERRVAVFRRIDGQMMAAAFDLADIRRNKMANPEVYPGDIVVVDGAGARALFRDIISTIPTIAVFSSI